MAIKGGARSDLRYIKFQIWEIATQVSLDKSDQSYAKGRPTVKTTRMTRNGHRPTMHVASQKTLRAPIGHSF